MQSAQEAIPLPQLSGWVPHSAPLLSNWPELPRDEPSPPATLEDFHRLRASSSNSHASRGALFSSARDDSFRKVSPSSSVPNLSRAGSVDRDGLREELAHPSVVDVSARSTSRLRPPRVDIDLSASQIHRISRVLDDIELQLSHTHHLPEEGGETTQFYGRPLLAAPSPARSRLADEDTEEIDPHMARLHRSLASASPAFSLRSAASLNVPVLTPAVARSPSAQGSIYDDAVEDQDDTSLHRSLTPTGLLLSQGTGSPATIRHESSFSESTTSVSPALSPVANRFPAVPGRVAEADDVSLEAINAEDEEAEPGHHHNSSVSSSTNPPSFNLLSPVLNASNSSIASAGSSYRCDDLDDDDYQHSSFSQQRPEPFEFDNASHVQTDRNALAQLSQENLGGLGLDDVAFIQDALIRTASIRAASRAGRSASAASNSDSGHGHGRFGAATPLSMDRHLENFGETDDEVAEELGTPQLVDDASHSPTTPSNDSYNLHTPPILPNGWHMPPERLQGSCELAHLSFAKEYI